MSVLSEDQVQNIVAIVSEYGGEVSPDFVREIEESYGRHGANGGGNQHGVVGSCIAMLIDQQRRIA